MIGVEPEAASDARASQRSGRIVEITAGQAGSTIADGLRTQRLGVATFAHIERFVDDVVTVSEDEIREAMRVLAWEARLLAEPSGAVALAGYLFRQEDLPPGRPAVGVISGGNVEPGLLAQILAVGPETARSRES